MKTNTKLKDLVKGKVERDNYNIFVSIIPFKSISIRLKENDYRGLFDFTCFQSGDDKRWICGMQKTSYYTQYVYSNTFDNENTVEDIITYINSVLRHLTEVLNKTF